MEAKIRLVLDSNEYKVRMDQVHEDLQIARKESESFRHSVASWRKEFTGFNQSLKTLDDERNSLNKLNQAFGDVAKQQTNYDGVNRNTVPGVNQMRMAVNQLGYVLNDSAMFAVNARMGMMGISNNLPMVIQLLRDAKAAAGDKTNMMKLLTSSITGGGGLIIGINALMLLLQVLPGLFESSKESMKELAKESEDLAKKLAELEKEIPGFDYSSIEMSFEKQKEFNTVIDESINKAKELREEKEKELKLLKEPITRVVRGEPVTIQRGETEEIKKVTSELEDYETKLAGLINKKEFFNSLLDRTQGKLVGLDERIKTQNITATEWKNLISRMTDNEISALTGSLNKSNSEIQRGSQEYITAKANLELLRKQIEATNKEKSDPAFVKADKELDIVQDHALNMAKIQEKGEHVILQMKIEFFREKIELYKKYNEDVTALTNELIETELELAKTVKPPKIEFGDLEPEDIEFDPDQVKKDMESMKQLRVDAISDSLSRQRAEIENWYSEKKETELYKNDMEARSLIDKIYDNKLRDLREQRLQEEKKNLDWMLNETGNAFRTIADLEMSGAEKRESILKHLYSSIIDLLWHSISEFIVAKGIELARHTSTERAKTAVTIEQVAIRSAVEAAGRAGSRLADAASGRGGGGGFLGSILDALGLGLLGDLFGFIGGIFGFDKGGAIIGENGPELIAPIETYADANRNLVTQTVLAVQGSLRSLQMQQAVDINTRTIEGLFSKNLEAINKWPSQVVFKVRGGDLKSAVDDVNDYYNKFEVR